jgi:hypothetical protein
MKPIAFICLLLVAVPLSVNAQHSSPSPAVSATTTSDDPQTELISLTQAWINAINAKNRSKLEELMAPEFTLQGWDGSWKVVRAQWLENLFSRINIVEYHHSAIVPHVYGEFAAVVSKWYWRGTRENQSDGQKPFEEHGYVVDLWRRRDAHWQVVSRTTVIEPGKE